MPGETFTRFFDMSREKPLSGKFEVFVPLTESWIWSYGPWMGILATIKSGSKFPRTEVSLTEKLIQLFLKILNPI